MTVQTHSFVDAEKFILDNGTLKREDGKDTSISLTQSQYTAFAQSHGVEPETLKAVAAVDKALIAGLTTTLGTLLAEDITAAKKAGEDPEDCRIKFHVQRQSGAYKGYMIPMREGRNPRDPSKTTITHAAMRLTVQTQTVQNDEALSYAASVVKAALN